MTGFWIRTLALLGAIALAAGAGAAPAGDAAQPGGRVIGSVIDEHNGMKLPGVTVEAAGTGQVTTTDRPFHI